MSKSVKTVLAIALIAATSSAYAGITRIALGPSANVPGHNWAKGDKWNVRAILLDSSMQPIGKLSPPAIFDTTSAALTPSQVKVTLDASASVGSIVRVYRSTTAFSAGADTEYADYINLCPCVPGDVFVSVSGRSDNDDFKADQPALPVKLQSYSVD
jgi:hypothetical protein